MIDFDVKRNDHDIVIKRLNIELEAITHRQHGARRQVTVIYTDTYPSLPPLTAPPPPELVVAVLQHVAAPHGDAERAGVAALLVLRDKGRVTGSSVRPSQDQPRPVVDQDREKQGRAESLAAGLTAYS